MKKLLIIILLCWAGKAIGQTPYWVPINNYQKIRGVWVDTIFKLPSDTTHYKTNGSLASLSGVLYICNGVKWSAVGGSGLNPDSLTLQKAYEKSVAAGQITPMINTSAAGLYIRGTDVVNRMSAQNSVDGTLSTVAADAVNKRAFLYSGTTYFDVFNGHYHTNLPSGTNYVLQDIAGDGNLTMQPLELSIYDTTYVPSDSTDYVDSTGQAQGRVLFSVAGRKISSDSLFRYDTVNHKLVINSANVSFVPDNYKLAINGEIYTKGVTMDVPVTNDNNYIMLNPVTKKQELKYFDTLTLIRSDTFLLRNDTLFVDTTNSSGGGSGWALTGNSGTSSSTNFLGTSDNTDMVFKRNNTEIFRNGNGYSLWGNGNDNTVTVANNGISVEKASSGYSTTLVPDYLSLVNSTNSINVNVGIHGIRPPAISTTLRSSIAYSTAGNIIYNTDSSKLQVYNGSSWVNLESGAGGGSGSETFEQTLQNQGSTAFTSDNTVDFDGHTLNLTNLGGQWNIHGTNGFGYSNAIGSPATPNDIGIYQSTGAYNSKIALHENKAQITGDEINISNVAGTDGYTLPTTDGTNGQVLTTDGSGAVSWQTGSGGGSSTYSGLSDVNLTSIADGQLVKWNNTSSKWENFDITSDKPTLLSYNSGTGHFDADTSLWHTYNFYNTKYMPLPSSPSNGDILYYNSGWQKLAKGNDGNILGLASGLPTWSAPNYGDSASHSIYAKTDNNLVVKLSLSDTVLSTSTAWQGSPFLEHSATGWSSSLASSMTAKVQQGIVITGAPASSWTNFKYSWYMSRRSSGMPVQEAMFLDETLGFATLNVPNLYATSLTRTASLQTGNISNATGGITISPVAQSNVVGNYSAISIAASSNNTSTHYFNGLVINSTQNRSGGSGTSTDFLIHRVETALSSGTQRFISADISGTEKFAVDNKGRIITTIPVDYTTLSPGTPSYSLGTGAGTSATASITGSDADGLITINTGTTPTAGGNIITVTFTSALTNSSKIQLTAYNSPASKCDVYINSDSSGFTIKNTDATDGGSALPASKTLIFHYTTTQ